jgi:general secretion pathway protein K
MDAMKASIPNLSASHAAPDGFIVVAVLWILGTLSALASIYAVYIINTATGFAVHDDRLRAEALVSAAVELTAYRQLAAQPAPGQSGPVQSAPTHGQFGFQLGQANVAVEFRSEAARIDLNAAPKQLLAGLFVALGARRDVAESYGDRIVAWRTLPANGQDSEASAYRMARLGYSPRGAKFPHTSELLLVRELPSALVERALPFVTVYSGRPQVNILDAAPEVIGAMPGMTPDRLNAVLTQRQAFPENGQALLPLLGPAQQFATIESSKALRVNVRIVFDNGRHANSEVVILIAEKDNKPFAVLSWHDELYEPAARNNLRRTGS